MDVNTLKTKTAELRTLFVLAQGMLPFVEELFQFSEKTTNQSQLFIPFMEELFAFIEETAPRLDEINSVIKDNLKRMPNASKQLSKVTQATEMASTEIMDTVDRVNAELFKVVKELENFRNNQRQLTDNPITLLKTLSEAIANGKDLSPFLVDIQQFIDRNNDIKNNEHITIVTNVIEHVQNISDDANTIINSMQIQDITAQQLAAVNNLIENIQVRLSEVMNKMSSKELTAIRNASFKNKSDDDLLVDTIKTSKLHRNIAYDPDAVDSLTAENRQEDIDAIFANPDSAIIEFDKMQNDNDTDNIDDLITAFYIQSDNAETIEEVVIENEITATEDAIDEEIDKDFSQEDIDAMFNNV